MHLSLNWITKRGLPDKTNSKPGAGTLVPLSEKAFLTKRSAKPMHNSMDKFEFRELTQLGGHRNDEVVSLIDSERKN